MCSGHGELGRYRYDARRTSKIISLLIIRLGRWLTWIPIGFDITTVLPFVPFTLDALRLCKILEMIRGHCLLRWSRKQLILLWQTTGGGACSVQLGHSTEISSDPFHGKLVHCWCVVPEMGGVSERWSRWSTEKSTEIRIKLRKFRVNLTTV